MAKSKASPHTWYIFRHGLATHSREGYGQQILTASVLPESVPVIGRMATFLREIPDSMNYTSDLLRCRQTAEIITRITDKQFLQDRRLTEYYQETFPEFRSRIRHFISDIKTVQSTNLLICTHGSVQAGIKHFLLEGKFLKKDLFDYTDCGQILIMHQNITKILDFNNTGP